MSVEIAPATAKVGLIGGRNLEPLPNFSFGDTLRALFHYFQDAAADL